MQQIQVRKVFKEIRSNDTLHALQLTALRFALDIEDRIGDFDYLQGFILGSEMGLGKSKVLAYLTKLNAIKKTLVITTFNTIFQLACVFLDICVGFKCYIIEKDDRFTMIKYQDDGVGIELITLSPGEDIGKYSIVFINPEKLITKNKIKLLTKYRWTRIIIDEAHSFRNEKTKTSLIVKQLPKTRTRVDGKMRNICSIILSTGTPIQNELSDLVSLFRIIDPNFLSDVFQESDMKSALKPYIKTNLFRVCVDNLTEEMKLIMKIPLDNPEITNIEVQPKETEFAEKLKNKSWSKILQKCRDEDSGRLFIKKLMRDELAYLIAACQKMQESSSNKGIDMNNLKILLSCPFDYDIFDDTEFEGKYEYKGFRSKDKEFCKLIRDNNESIVIFHEYGQAKDYYTEILEDNFPDLDVYSISGKDTLEERFITLSECNSSIKRGEKVVMFSSITATCEGMNYQSFPKAIFIDHRANPQQERQAITRLHRMGQLSSVYIWFLCYKSFETRSGTVEVDTRLRDIKDEKLKITKILKKNAAIYYKRDIIQLEDGTVTTGLNFGDEFENKPNGSKNGPDSVGELLKIRN